MITDKILFITAGIAFFLIQIIWIYGLMRGVDIFK